VGVDILPGPGVDELCDAARLVERFRPESFDYVVCTDALEHIRDWRSTVSNMKGVLRPDGVLLVSVPSRGFSFHSYPYDFWRYESDDLRAIFADCAIVALDVRPDPPDPVVFMLARKPRDFRETDTSGYALFSMITRRRSLTVSNAQIRVAMPFIAVRGFVGRSLPPRVAQAIKRWIDRSRP
jgi:SAM-dependent methyltransferase